MANYRWANPQEWLASKLTRLANEDEYPEILEIARTLLDMVDADQVQNVFQQEMDDDGYFTPTDLIECPDCGEAFDASQMADPEQHLSLERQKVCLDCHRAWLEIDGLQSRGCPGGSEPCT